MTAVAEIVVAADSQPWRRFGLPLDADGCAVVGGVRIRVIEPVDRVGIVSWGLCEAPQQTPSSIDGLATHTSDAPARHDEPAGELGAVAIDHLVVWTDDLERTCAAITTATGAELKRVRELGTMRQGFHRLGEVIVEVVQHPGVEPGPATFWGFVLNVVDLDDVAAHLGPDVVTPPKDAVQPGRRIATVRAEAGLGVPMALMT